MAYNLSDGSMTFFKLGCVVAILVTAYLVCSVVYLSFFHPLANFKGPWLNRITQAPVYISVLQGRRTQYEAELLRRYGSPVRIGPSSLVFGDSQSIKDIYGQSSTPCLKDPVTYEAFSITGGDNLISVIGRKQHSRLRRLHAHGLSLKSILQSEQMIANHVETFTNVVVEPVAGLDQGPVDIYESIFNHYLDIVSHVCFAESFGTIAGRSLFSHRDLEHWMTAVPATGFFPMIRYLPLRWIQEALAGLARLEAFSRKRVTDHADLCRQGKVANGPSGREAILTKLHNAIDEETGTQLTEDELTDNAIALLVAGSDTTSITTIYVLWEISRNIDIWKAVADEVRAAFPDRAKMPTYTELCKLPYLNAVIDETLRLWGPLNISLPRISPGKIISHLYVPPGVVVSTNTYTTNRNPIAYPQPHVFQPERWLESPSIAMRENTRPFSSGPHNCIGRHLAEVSFRITVARIVQLYDITPSDDMSPEKMDTEDTGSLQPCGRSLRVHLSRVKQDS